MLLAGISLVLILGLMAIGLPVAFTFALVAILGFIITKGFNMTANTVGVHYLEYLSRYVFTSLPLFFFMGQLGYHSGLMEGLFDAGRAWLGRLRAGLALTVVACCTAYAACTTSAVACILILGRSAVPTMQKAGYSDEMCAGILAGSAALAALIPPSGLLVMFGILTGESIGKLLIAAWLPGFLQATVLAVFAFVWARNVPRDQARYTWKQRFISIKYVSVIVITVFALMGGMYLGWATPTESGAIGAFVTFVVAVIARKMGLRAFWRSVTSTAQTVGSLIIIIGSGALYARFLAAAGFNNALINWIAEMHAPPIVVFLFFAFLLLVIGCFIDVSSMMVITLPVMYPILMRLGYDGIWFGIVYIVFCQIAALTPPYAVSLFAIRTIAPEIPMSKVVKGATVFVIADIIVIGLFYAFPEVVAWLPARMVGG